MASYVSKRIFSSIITIALVTFVSFLFVALIPGEPAQLLLGQWATPEKIAAINHQWGLDKPLFVRYGIWLKNLLQGNLGQSLLSRKPTLELLSNAFPVSFELCLLSMLVACSLGILAGILASILRPVSQRFLMFNVLVAQSIPSYVSALILILLICVRWQLLPASGYVTFLDDPLKNLRSLLLPSISLGLVLSASIARFTRGCMLDILREDYIRTARSKGAKESSVIVRHAFRSAMIPVVSLVGAQIVFLAGGAIIQEIIFVLPGMGRLVVTSLLNRDYSVIQGVILLIAGTATLVNLLVDLLYGFLDPRIRYE